MSRPGGLSGAALEEALAEMLYGASEPFSELDPLEVEEATKMVRQMILERTHRGTGRVTDWFPKTLACWRASNDALAAEFCRSSFCAERRGFSLEEAWFRFFERESIGEPHVREEEFLGAIVRALAVTPRARFRWPDAVRPAPGGCFAVSCRLVLHAALDGRYLRGEVTPLIAAILDGEPLADERVRAQLRAMRLID